MSSAEPTASTEKPILEPISTTEHTDFLSTEVSENSSKTQHAKSIGTTTPEVEGEEQQLIAAVEDYPTTPVSAIDPKSSSLLRLTETLELEIEEAPLPPSSLLEISPSLSLKEAEEKALPQQSPLEKAQLEAHELQLEEKELIETKDKLPHKEEEREDSKEEPISLDSDKKTTATIETQHVEGASESVADKLLTDNIKESVLGGEDTSLEKNEKDLPLSGAASSAEPEKLISDHKPPLQPESGASEPTTEEDKPLVEELGIEVGEDTSKSLPHDTKVIDLDDKPQETKEVEVPEEKTVPIELTSASAAIDEISTPSELETVKEIPSEPVNEVSGEAHKDSETMEVAKEETAVEKPLEKDTPEKKSTEMPNPISEVEAEEAKAVGPNTQSSEVASVVEETSPTEEVTFSGETSVDKDTPELVSAEGTIEDHAKETEEVVAVTPEAGAVEVTDYNSITQEAAVAEKHLPAKEKEASETEGTSEPKPEATALDGTVALDESPVAIEEPPVTSEALELVSEAESIIPVPEIAKEIPTIEEVPFGENSTTVESSTAEEPIITQTKPTIDQELTPDSSIVDAISTEEATTVENGPEVTEPKEVTSLSSELKEAVVAEPTFNLLDETQEPATKEHQTEKATTATEQSLDDSTPILITEGAAPVEVGPKEDKQSEEQKGLENVEKVQEDVPLKDLETMAEPSTGETAVEELLIVDQAPELNVTSKESPAIEDEAKELKAEPPIEDLAAVAEIPEDSLEKVSQPAEGQAATEEPVTKEVPVVEKSLIPEDTGSAKDTEEVKLAEPEDAIEEIAEPTIAAEERPEVEDKQIPSEVITDSGKEASEVPAEVPEIVVELTAKNQPSHGDDLGPDATPGQQDAFEKRKADAEPDRLVIVEEPSTPESVPVDMTAAEPTLQELEKEIPHGSSEEEEKPQESAGEDRRQEQLSSDHETKTEQTPTTESRIEESPAVEDTPTTKEAPAEEPLAVKGALEEVSGVEENPVTEETPILEGVLAAKDISTVEETPVVGEILPAIEETSNIEEDAVVISHDDAKPEDVAEAEAAVKIPDPVDDEASEDAIITEITEPLPSSQELKEEKAEIHETPETASNKDSLTKETPESLSQEVSINPLPASETPNNPINLAPGEKVPEFGASSINANVKLDPESYEKADASNFGVKHNAVPEEIFSVNPLPAFETVVNPINLKPGEPVPDIGATSIESAVKLDEESYEKADASNLGVKQETATAEPEDFSVKPLPASETAGNPIELQPGEPVPQIEPSSIESNVRLDQKSYEEADASNLGVRPDAASEIFSISPLPASETATNPIDLQPGEPIPEIGSMSVESNVKLDEESYEQADASNLGVKPPTTLETPEEVQEVSINPFPASQTPGNPIELQPGEPIPKDQLNIVSLDANVKLDEESYERADASNFGVQPTTDDQSIPKLTDKVEPSTDVVDMDGVKEADQSVGELVGAPEAKAPSTMETTEGEDNNIGFEASPEPTETETVEPGLFVDKSTGEITAPADPESNVGIIAASVLGGVAALGGGGAAIIALTSEDNTSSSETSDNKTPKEPTGTDKKQAVAKHVDEESIMEPSPQTAPSQVHGVIVPEADAKQVIEDADTSEAPAILISSPPISPAVGKQQDEEDRTVEVIEPTPEIVIEGSTPNAVGRESENTPEGVRRRLAESTSLSRPVSSGNDNISAKQHKNIMRTFWNLLLFNWLGGFGKLFGFGKKSKKPQRATQ